MLKNRFPKFILLAIFLSSMACSHSVHHYHVSEYEPLGKRDRAKPIEAQAEQFVIFHFTTQTDYVNAAYEELQSKCSKGRITGINTRYSTSHGFFSWTNKIKMKAKCIYR